YLFHALSLTKDLLRSDPNAAERAIVNLSNVFRFTLDATRHDSIRLGDELELIKSYLDIESAGSQGLLTYEIDIPANLFDAQAPPLLLHQLVEYTVGDAVAGGRPSKIITLTARGDGDTIAFQLRGDTVPAIGPGELPAPDLEASQATTRLREITGVDSLRVLAGAAGCRIVEFTLPRGNALLDGEPRLRVDQY
ncbi:MAG TPA: histidine kinase, partial [Blastocatellia bacterium]|nr:histidine kinase [Blastocatellia bacterium]